MDLSLEGLAASAAATAIHDPHSFKQQIRNRRHIWVSDLCRVPPIIEFGDNPPILRCAGDEDRNTQSFRRQALIRALQADRDVVVDLTDLVFADGSLMADLAMVSRRLRKRGRALLLKGAQPQIMKLIEIFGLHRLPGVRIEGPMPAAA